MITQAIQEYLFQDANANFTGMIALSEVDTYPALGGCRLVHGKFTEASRQLCIKLAQAMSYKAALHQLPLSGGKSVICIDSPAISRTELLSHYAKLLNQLAGRYITAVDIGLDEVDMNQLAQLTPHVTGYAARGGDPSRHTAKGLRLAMEAAVAWNFKQATLDGLHIAIQGVGKVGYALLQELAQYNVKLSISDINPEQLEACRAKFAVTVVPPEQIYQIACDIFAPCAQGYILNSITIPQLRAKLIVGAANNQLADVNSLKLLEQHNIFYAPDYLVNAGGLISCAHQYYANFDLQAKINAIYDLSLNIFKQATQLGVTPYSICSQLAETYLSAH